MRGVKSLSGEARSNGLWLWRLGRRCYQGRGGRPRIAGSMWGRTTAMGSTGGPWLWVSRRWCDRIAAFCDNNDNKKLRGEV